MFYFLNFSGDTKAQSYDQGILFEKLVREIVESMGYRITKWREKISGKEYDIRGVGKLDNRTLIGEAKARRENQPMPTISGFIGSLDHKDLPSDTLGLFISISDIAADARDFLNNSVKRDRIVEIVGQQIFDRLGDIGYPTLQQIKNWASAQFSMRTGDTHFLVSDRGNYFIQTLVRNNETRIKAFCVFDSNGTRIEEQKFGKEIKERIEDFQELVFLASPQIFSTHLDDVPGRIGLDREGIGWFEYKLPAHPECFIGREKQIQDFSNFLRDVLLGKTNIRIYQILSPSGVGKSSFLLKIHNENKEIRVATFQDARNFRASVDLLNLLQEFIENAFVSFHIKERIPSDKLGILECFPRIDNELLVAKNLGVIFVDQFESLFLKPEIYIDFLDLVLEITHSCKNIVFCIARKNDQPTTFDEKERIDLQRLTQLSKSVELRDFSTTEATELLSHLNDELEQPLKPKLRNMILEFSASGFPWLVKRICAHIRDMLNKRSMTQDELIQNGVRSDELFEEDLAGLDIVDREYLKELVYYFPATLEDLSQVDKFRGKFLSAKLSLFQNQRLIRLIGRTYDTYNDVFKYFLKHGDVPHPNKYTFRTPPITSIRLLRNILENKPHFTEDVQGQSDLDEGSVFNALRELRMLELVDYSRGNLVIDDGTLRAWETGELDKLIKERVWKNNGLVQDVLTKITTEGEIELTELITLMKESLPILELSSKTWDSYARTLVSWLKFVGLIKPDAITVEGRAIGATKRGPKSEYFLPSAYVSQIISLMELFLNREYVSLDEIEEIRLAKADCIQLGLIETIDENQLQLTLKGQEFLRNQIARPRVFRDFLIELSYINDYLSQITGKSESHLIVIKQTLGDTAFTDETWEWRSKILVNWLEVAGLIVRKGGRITYSTQMDLFAD